MNRDNKKNNKIGGISAPGKKTRGENTSLLKESGVSWGWGRGIGGGWGKARMRFHRYGGCVLRTGSGAKVLFIGGRAKFQAVKREDRGERVGRLRGPSQKNKGLPVVV